MNPHQPTPLHHVATSVVVGSSLLGLILLFGIVTDLSGAVPSAVNILFVGDSFTHGHATPVLYYNAAAITDVNGTGYGGVPGIFKQLTVDAGLNYNVTIEAISSMSLYYFSSWQI